MTVRPRVKLLTLAALFVTAVVGFVPAPPATAASYTSQVIDLTNMYRRKIMGRGCPNLVASRALTRAAQWHASDMARNNYFSHTSRNGSSFWRRITAAGYRPRRAAENIAAGNMTAKAAVLNWMRSPAHRRNILDCRLREIGVGIAYTRNSYYGTYGVENFGARR